MTMDWFMLTLAALLAAGLIAVAVTVEVLALARASRVEDEQRFPRVLRSAENRVDAVKAERERAATPDSDLPTMACEAVSRRHARINDDG